MKKLILLIVIALTLTSFNLNNSYPCHPLGDIGPCKHPVHAFGDIGPCTHTYFDIYGNYCYQHSGGDLYPCTHAVHNYDLYPCTHICW